MSTHTGARVWSPSREAIARAAKRRPMVYPQINAMPLLGVCFVLLFIFMCIVPPLHTDGVMIARPLAENAVLQPRAIREDAIHIEVTRDGHSFFGTEETAPEKMRGRLKTALAQGSENKAYILVDRRAKNADVEKVVDQIRLAGIRDVVFLTDARSALKSGLGPD